VLKTSGERVDLVYVTNWAVRLGVKDIWDQILAERGKKP
jgi:hypothetical protein